MQSFSNRICRDGAVSRRFGLVVVVLSLVAGLAPISLSAQEVPLRIAVVDLEYIVANSPAGRSLQQRLTAFSETVNAEVKTRRDAATAIRTQIAQGANTLSTERLSELQTELDTANTAIQRYQEDKQKEGQKMQTEGLRQIEEQLKPVFEELTSERGFDLILNNVPGVVVMAGPRADITQAVLDKLNAAASDG